MKVICTTSNKYLHLLPVFAYLFNKYWGEDQEVTIVGYDIPKWEPPANMTFHSMGVQGDVSEWSTDLRRYFESLEDEFICWLMEDTFLKSVDQDQLTSAYAFMMPGIGRIDLTKDVQKRKHRIDQMLVIADPHSQYRLSTQPSIWNKEFLLQYLTPGLTPWKMETQNPMDDGWNIIGLVDYPVLHNEGVRKFDPHKLDLNGFPQEDLDHIKTLL